jgi:hypothetical protein
MTFDYIEAQKSVMDSIFNSAVGTFWHREFVLIDSIFTHHIS